MDDVVEAVNGVAASLFLVMGRLGVAAVAAVASSSLNIDWERATKSKYLDFVLVGSLSSFNID